LRFPPLAAREQLNRNLMPDPFKAEEYPSDSENVHRPIFHDALNGICYCRTIFENGRARDFVFLTADGIFTAQAGFKDASGKKASELVPGIREADPELFDRLGRLSVTGQPGRFEIFLHSLQKWFLISASSPEWDHFFAVIVDVAGYKKTEELSRRNEERYARVLAGSDLGFWDWDLTKQEFSVSPRFETMLGYAPGEMQLSPDNWASYVHPDDLAKSWESIDRHLKGLSPSHEVELRCRTKSGEWKWVLTKGSVVARDEDGAPLIMSGTHTDIHERKQAEEALRKSEARFRVALTNSQVTVFEQDIELRYTYNQRPYFGYSSEQVIGKRDRDLLSPENAAEIEAIKQSVIDTGVPVRKEIHVTAPGKPIEYFDLYAEPLRDESGKIIGILCTAVDITEHEKAHEHELRLKNIYRALSATNEAIIHTVSESALFPLVCRIAVECGGLQLAWVGIPDETGKFMPVASEGKARSYLDDLTAMSTSLSPEGRGCTGTAFREMKACIINDLENNEASQPWREKNRQYGINSIASFPILRQGGSYAILAVYSDQVGAFDEEIVHLLEEIAGNISFALDNFDREAERARSESALKESETRFRQLADAMPQLVWTADPDGRVDYFNQRHREYPCLAQMDTSEFDCVPVIHPDDVEASIQAWSHAVATGEAYQIEHRIKHADGGYRWHINRAVPVRNGQGRIVKWYGTATDVHDLKMAQEAARESEGRFRTLFENAGDGIFIGDTPGHLIDVNAHGAKMLGYSHQEIIERKVTDILAEHERVRVPDNWEGWDIGSNAISEWLFLRKDGSTFLGEVNSQLLPDGRIIGIMRDVTERKKVEEELKLAAMVYHDSSEAMMVTDANDIIISVNPAFERITGYDTGDAIGRHAEILLSGRHGEDFFESIATELNASGYWKGELWSRRKNHESFAALITFNTSFHPDGSVNKRVILFSDITVKKEAEEKVWQQANFDTLTGLPNRNLFKEHLRHEIRNSRRMNLPMALMFLDLDGFKDVNDTLGHDMGDILLKDAAGRLRGCVRDIDIVARLGGDEFTIVLPELHDARNADRIARHILKNMSRPFQLGDEVAHVSASIGITFYPEDATEIDDLLKNADQAMYAAKQNGKDQHRYFTASMQETAQARMRLVNDLRGALDNGQFMIAYQPIVELASGAIHKAEALIRWQHPTRGLINPIEFISAAEDTGMIADFGNWIFHAAVKQVTLWREKYLPDFQISVNISPVQFKKDGIDAGLWMDQLKELDLPGQGIVVEITEGLLLDASPKVTDQFLMLRDAGIEVALDDFGTGYSSLSYLKKFDIDYIKIDQSFIHNLTTDSDDMALCEAIIVMAHKLGIKVIAEGIETKEQSHLLASAGCDYGQGYLFSKPVFAAEFELLFTAFPILAE